MKQTEQNEYLSPEIEVLEMSVEQGFSGSNLENIEEEKDPIDWN